MHGTFNGVRLSTITSRKLVTTPQETKLYGFRVTGMIPRATSEALEATLRLHGPALLIFSDEIVEGRIVAFGADTVYGYEVTIEIPTDS